MPGATEVGGLADHVGGAVGERSLERVDEEAVAVAAQTLEGDGRSEQLAAHTLPVVEVAFRLGFSDQSAFSKAFKRWTGMNPAGYRRSRAAS
jgi:AraC-like DNA-binding protein